MAVTVAVGDERIASSSYLSVRVRVLCRVACLIRLLRDDVCCRHGLLTISLDRELYRDGLSSFWFWFDLVSIWWSFAVDGWVRVYACMMCV